MIAGMNEPRCAPETEQWLNGNVEAGRDDRKRMEDHDRRDRDYGRKQPPAIRPSREQDAQSAKERQAKVRQPINEHPRLGIGFVEDDEVPQARRQS